MPSLLGSFRSAKQRIICGFARSRTSQIAKIAILTPLVSSLRVATFYNRLLHSFESLTPAREQDMSGFGLPFSEYGTVAAPNFRAWPTSADEVSGGVPHGLTIAASPEAFSSAVAESEMVQAASSHQVLIRYRDYRLRSATLSINSRSLETLRS